jgi:hypothetical protein
MNVIRKRHSLGGSYCLLLGRFYNINIDGLDATPDMSIPNKVAVGFSNSEIQF